MRARRFPGHTFQDSRLTPRRVVARLIAHASVRVRSVRFADPLSVKVAVMG